MPVVNVAKVARPLEMEFMRNHAAIAALTLSGLMLMGCQGTGDQTAKPVENAAPAAAATPAPDAAKAEPEAPKPPPLKLGFDTQMPAPYKRDVITLKLGPYEGREYVYRLEKGAGMVYSWSATGKVRYDFHGQPDGSAPDYAETFIMGEGTESHGVFISPDPGIHGWFWENLGIDDVTVTLTSAGFYTAGTEYSADGKVDHKLRER